VNSSGLDDLSMQAAYRDHAGNREPMFKLESNYSAKGNLPAIKQPWGHARCRPHVSDAVPLFEPPNTISHCSFVVLCSGSRLPTLLLLIPEAPNQI